MSNEHLGMGVMIHRLFGDGGASAKAFKKALGQKITALSLSNNVLHFEFANGYKMGLLDDGQSCCEHRWMQIDDNLADFIGATFVDAEVASAPNIPYGEDTDYYGDPHEVQFLRVHTDKGTIVAANHNEHNGYYGGFAVVAREE